MSQYKNPTYISIFGVAFVCLLLFCLPTVGFSQNITWTGNIDAAWNKAGNWSSNQVPGQGDNVYIEPNNGNPYPEISQSDVTVASVQVSNYNGGELTVSNGRTLTITNGLTFQDNGMLFIRSGGAVHLSGGNFDMGYGDNTQINIENGSFTSDVHIQAKQRGFDTGSNVDLNFNAGFEMAQGTPFNIDSGNLYVDGDLTTHGNFTVGDADITVTGNVDIGSNTTSWDQDSGSLNVGGTFKLESSQTFNAGTADVTIDGQATINGTYNGEDGNTTFNSQVTVNSGGVINLDSGTISFNSGTFIGNNGTVNLGEGTVNMKDNITVKSGGHFNVQDATVNIKGDADFTSNGNLSIDNGSINVEGNASLSSGGTFDLNNGSLNVGGDATFTNGGTVNAGNSQITLKGNLNVPYSGTFNPDSSTVTFSGDSKQTINTNGDDLTFYNVKVDSGSSVQTDGSSQNTITITNNLTVEDGGSVGVKDDDTIDIQGDLDNQGDVQSIKPFVYAVSTPSLTKVLVTFDQPMTASSTERVSNYSINNGITVNNATLHPSDHTKVTLDVSTLTKGVTYELIANDVYSEQGGKISNNHIKRFTVRTDITYYSRKNGDWDDPTSWSTQSHTGSAASKIPNEANGEKALIGNSNTITLGSTQDVTNMKSLTIENSGKLSIASGDSLILNQFVIGGNGTFDLQDGGTIRIGSTSGITDANTGQGNIQTAIRNYSSTANYIYAGSATQKTGSGLPQNVHDLRINNGANVTASANLKVNGTLYLQNGSLVIPSGQELIANTQSVSNGNLIFKRILSGTPGWRMISSPVKANYNNFLDGILTQGYTGSQLGITDANGDSLQPNILYYDETYPGTDNQRWRTPSSASIQVPAGQGYNAYLFGDVSGDNRYNDPLPDTLSVEGQEHSGTGGNVDLNVTYTAKADTGWNLVGNPYGATIDWDKTGSWTKTNIDQTIYVWDPDSKSYKTWNGTTGSLNDGLIPPFQAFWIKANAQNPTLKVDQSAKTFGGSFVGKIAADQNPRIEIQLTDSHHDTSSIFFSFYDDARVGKDSKDGYYLQPPPGINNYSEIFSIGRNHNRFNINALPLNFGVPIEIPISANIFKNGTKASELANLHIADMNQMPLSWAIALVDRKTGQEITPSKGKTYKFKTFGSSDNSVATDTTKNILDLPYHILADADPSEARFVLKINPGSSGTGLPHQIGLKQNYPNPFNPTTTIRFTLPIQNKVTLKVYDILGRKVATLLNHKSFQAGLHKVTWDASNVASGTYIYRLQTPEKVISKKMTVIE